MGFGFGASDVYTATALALKVYQRCRDSVSEFNDISKEVNVLYMVLEAIETHWKENELDSTTRKNLDVHTEGCVETLRDLEAILDKHKSLGMVKKRKFERFKWVGQNLAPIRTALLNKATYLSMYHDTICSTANSRVIRALSIRLQETESGKRVSPALSQASHQGLQHDDPETWLTIEEDLVGAGVDAASLGSEHDLIKRFVDNVWAGGDVNDDNPGAQSEELEEDGSDDYSDGQNEEVGKSKGDAASVQGPKGEINDRQEVKSRPQAPKTRSAEHSDPSIVDFRSSDVIWDSEYENLWDQVINNRKQIRSQKIHGYKKMEALLLSWDQSCSDMDTEIEAKTLKAVFETRFGYCTTVEHLNAYVEKKLQAQLNSKVALFVENYKSPDTLLIMIYAGHGRPGGERSNSYLYGQALQCDMERRTDNIYWNMIEKLLELAEVDVLHMFDGCYAGQLGFSRGAGQLDFISQTTRKFETLAATKAMDTTTAPGRDSFTSALIWALEALAESQDCFTTLELLKATINEAPHLPKNQTPVLSDRVHYSSADRIMLSPLSTHQSIPEPRVYRDSNPRQQHTVTLHFDFAEKPSLPVIEKLGDQMNKIVFTRDRLPIDKIRWGGMRSRAPNDFVPLYRQVVVKEGTKRRGETQQTGESNGGSSICPEAARSEHPHRTKRGRHAPVQHSPAVHGPLMLKRRETSPEPTSFLWDLSEESEDQCVTPRKKNRGSGQPPSVHAPPRS